MVGAIIILLVTISVGILLYIYDLQWRRKHPHISENNKDKVTTESISAEVSEEDENSHGAICCGRHLICDKSLSPLPGEEIVYYDDEELDAYKGRLPESYSEDEVEEFRDVMMTMNQNELAGWARSLQLREIHMPQQLRDEFILLVSDTI